MNIYPYAGFWKRVLAHVLDSFILAVPLFILRMLIYALLSTGQTEAPSQPVLFNGTVLISACATFLSSFLVTWLYNALMESSKCQATLGKMALKIKVVDAKGDRIGFWRATCRCLGRILSANFTFYFGYYMAGFTRQNQTLHDILTDTFVVSNQYQAGQELPAHPFRKEYCVVSIITAILPVLLLCAFVSFFIATVGSH